MDCVYLIRLGSYVKLQENVYKIGRTDNFLERLKGSDYRNGYNKNIEVYGVWPCENNEDMENEIIYIFDKIFIKRTDLGNEYYEGDVSIMQYTIYKIVNQPNTNQPDVVDVVTKRTKKVKRSHDEFVQEFVDMIRETRPNWYIAGERIEVDDFHNHYKEAGGWFQKTAFASPFEDKLWTDKIEKKSSGKPTSYLLLDLWE